MSRGTMNEGTEGDQLLLEHKSVVITGAGYGLGRAYALEAARQGANVVLNDVDEKRLSEVASTIARSSSAGIEVVAGSVSDWSVAVDLFERCESVFGAVDGLVNNAGVIHATKVAEEEPEDLRRIVETNVLGAMFCGTNALRHMAPKRSGSIVNITSGALGGIKGLSAYGATKGSVASMVYGWSLEARDYGVRVNGVMPMAATGMGEQLQVAFQNMPVQPATADAKVEQRPEFVAPVVVYLLSDLSEHLNGEIIRHDGARISLLTRPAWSDGHALDNEMLDADDVARIVDSLRATS